jgi:hypothetical protein
VSAWCLAWGEDGHRIVGVIAADRLSPEARAAVVELLGSDDLATAGLWADQIRSDAAWDWAKPLHYVNLPRDGSDFDAARDCPEGQCVVAAIPRFLAVASDSSRPISERRDALRFAVHFIGDLHQPLHAGYKDDLGGNRIQVTAFGDIRTNLHALWDSVLIRDRIAGDWQALAQSLRGAITPALAAEWASQADSAAWANESAAITRTIYAELPADAKVGAEYAKSNMPTIERRLSMAGVRLAQALNRAFKVSTGASGSGAPAPQNHGQVDSVDRAVPVEVPNGRVGGSPP